MDLSFLDEKQQALEDNIDAPLLVPEPGLSDHVANRFATMTAIAEDEIPNYDNIRNDLRNTGRSSIMDNAIRFNSLDKSNQNREIAKEIISDSTLTPEQKKEQVTSISSKAVIGSLIGAMEENVKASRLQTLEQEPAVSRNNFLTGYLNEHEELKKSVQKSIDREVLNMNREQDESDLAVLAEGAVNALVPGYAIHIGQAINEALPGVLNASDYVFGGESLKKFRTAMKSLPTNKKIEVADRLVKAIVKNNSFFSTDQLTAVTTIDMLLGDLDPSISDSDFERWTNNFFSVLDIIPGVTAAKKLASSALVSKIARGQPSTIVRKLATIHPTMLKPVLTQAVKDDQFKETLHNLGMRAEDVIDSYVLPRDIGSDIHMGPDLTDALKERFVTDIKGVGTFGQNYFPEEKAGSIDKVQAHINDLTTGLGVTTISRTKIQPITGGFRAQTAISATDSSGFSSLQEARDVALRYAETLSDESNIQYYKANIPRGRFDLVTKNTRAPGEYIFTIDLKHLYNPNDVQGLHNIVEGFTGKPAAYMDMSSVLTKRMVNAINVAGESSDKIRSDLHLVLKPLLKLKNNHQNKVLNILEEGYSFQRPDGDRGKWFTVPELDTKFKRLGAKPHEVPKLIEGYQSAMRFAEETHDLMNKKIRRELVSNGYKRIMVMRNRLATPDREPFLDLIGAPLKRSDISQDMTKVYSVELKTDILVTPELLDNWYAVGSKVIKLEEPTHFGTASGKVTHILMNSSTDGKILDLPAEVLKKHEGYIPTSYKAAYLVKMKHKGLEKVDGTYVEGSKTIFIEDNIGDAERAVRILKGRNTDPNVTFEHIVAKEKRDLDHADGASLEYFKDSGRLFTSKRSPRELKSFTGKRVIENIGDSYNKAIASAAKHVAMDDLIESMVKRWEAAYSERLMGGESFPFNTKKISRPTNEDRELQKMWKDAIALQDKINHLAGLDKSIYDNAFDQVVTGFAKIVAGDGETKWRNMASALALEHGPKLDVFKGLKTLAYLRHIVMEPTKQVIMQANSMTISLGVEHGREYFLGGRGVRDYQALIMGMALDKGSAAYKIALPHISSAVDMSPREYEVFVDAFKNSGLVQSLNSHNFVAAMALDSRVSSNPNMYNVPVDVLNSMKGILRLGRSGFKFGEFNNITAAFLVTRNKWIKNYKGPGNPNRLWALKDNLDQIVGETKAITQNMSEVGSTKFQKGGLGLMFQFTSYAHKSMNALLPFMKGKAFTPAEKRRILTQQFILYGTSGLFGLDYAVNEIRDRFGIVNSPEANQLISGMVVNYSINKLINIFEDEEELKSNIDVANTLAPLQGLDKNSSAPLTKIARDIYDIVTKETISLEEAGVIIAGDFAGPGINTAADIVDAFKRMHSIFNYQKIPEDASSGEYSLILEEAIKLIPIMDREYKYKLWKATGQLVSRTNDPIVATTRTEMVSKALFGTNIVRERETSGLYNDIIGGRIIQTESSVGANNKKVAKYLYDQMAKTLKDVKPGQYSQVELIDSIANSRKALTLVYGEYDAQQIMKHVRELAMFERSSMTTTDKNRQGKGLEFNKQRKVEEFLTKHISDGFVKSQSQLATKALNSGVISEELMDRIREAIQEEE